ncbi:MAG: HAD-IIIC family phosphatase [Candidatus Omnitrophica bacterium]|nr:HAD-IIIC family phosphatase [Candidatus Omnitrophota bacterium]
MPDPAPVRVALVGSGTLRHVPELVSPRCAAHGIQTAWYVAPYGQWQQEVINPASELYTFRPELTILVVSARELLSGLWTNPYGVTVEERRSAAEDAANRLSKMAQVAATWTSGLVLVHGLAVPTSSPLGLLESKQKFGWLETVRWINQRLQEEFRNDARVFLLDLDSVLSRSGKDAAFDDRLYYLADMELAPDAWSRLGDDYARYLLALRGRSRKCLVLDLDNTLWGGIVGEDGFDGIQLGATPPGNTFVAFQQELLALFERGVLLAVNSANNPDDALKVIREHPAMVLREPHFASMKINWEPKTENLRAIAEELNLGLDSLVYLDDEPAQRWLVSQQLPEVLVPELPPDPAGYARTLQRLVGLDAVSLTPEDRRRGAMYAQERSRREFRTQVRTLDEYLSQLQVQIRLREADRFSIPRLAQLTQRTNQFNLTLERYTESQLAEWLGDPRRRLYAIEVSDRFGDQGISGALSIERHDRWWDVPLWLLSCRVLGKGVEQSVLSVLAGWAKAGGVSELRVAYRPSEKNTPARRFLEACGVSLMRTDDSVQRWQLELAHVPAVPAHVTVTAE